MHVRASQSGSANVRIRCNQVYQVYQVSVGKPQKSKPGPPAGAAGAAFFGASVTVASVVSSKPAIDAAFCSAVAAISEAPLLLSDHGDNVFFAQHKQFVAVDLDLLARVLSEENALADLQVGLDALPSLSRLPGPTAMTSPGRVFLQRFRESRCPMRFLFPGRGA